MHSEMINKPLCDLKDSCHLSQEAAAAAPSVLIIDELQVAHALLELPQCQVFSHSKARYGVTWPVLCV